MTARRVAISQRRDPTGPPHDEVRDALDHRLAGFVLAAGALPVPVPSALTGRDLSDWLAAVAPDAVLLSGGPDIGLDPVRDRLDLALVDHARRGARPLLALCRGMQVLAQEAGAPVGPVDGHVARRHVLSGEIAREVNSFHAQGLFKPPKEYRTLAQAPDGTVEAIAHDTLPWEGWMWHPEREERLDPDDVARFQRILS